MRPPTPARILVVDDDRDNLANLADLLGDLGHEVDIASDPRAALELARDRPYQIALLDLRMPGMDGITLYRELKSIQPAIVALLVTAYAGTAAEQEALEAGTWKVLSKPIRFTDITRLVGEALGWPLVLIVDDDRDLCASLWDALRTEGYRVSTAANREEAVARMRGADIDIVIADFRIPGSSDGELLELARTALPNVPTILITGHSEAIRARSEGSGELRTDAICYKPFNMRELLDTIKRLTRVMG